MWLCYSPHYIMLQSVLHHVTVHTTSCYSPYYIMLQSVLHHVTVRTTSCYSPYYIMLQSILHNVTGQAVLSQKPQQQCRDVGPVINLFIVWTETHPGDISSGFRLWRLMIDWLIDWLRVGSWPYSPDAPRPLLTDPLCPVTIYGSPVTLPKFQMPPRLTVIIFSGSRKKQPRYTCLSEAKASHRQRLWAEVSSSAPHFLHNGLSISPIK
jgi:hypothetical protein